jgi:hypothetical protein
MKCKLNELEYALLKLRLELAIQSLTTDPLETRKLLWSAIHLLEKFSRETAIRESGQQTIY